MCERRGRRKEMLDVEILSKSGQAPKRCCIKETNRLFSIMRQLTMQTYNRKKEQTWGCFQKWSLAAKMELAAQP
jgi:hypothetical protein